MKLLGYRIPMAFSLILWAGLWEIVGRTGASFVIPPLSRIFGGVAEGKVVLDSLFDRGQVSAAMEVAQREQVSKQRR